MANILAKPDEIRAHRDLVLRARQTRLFDMQG